MFPAMPDLGDSGGKNETINLDIGGIHGGSAGGFIRSKAGQR
jgi:hypothetical protein